MNRYDVEKVVGEGSYGKALLCKRKSDHRKCIIKQISITKMSSKQVKQTEQESSLLSKFSHPNIVSFWESFSTPTHLFIVMEYADGGDLDSYVKKQRGSNIPEQVVLNLFVQISLALKHVHDRKILHRDLKCQNIFLTSKGICKLGDFGVSRILQGTMEMAATQIGTPYYMSPEIMQGKIYNSKTDIWSLAVIFYELLCLRVPFDGQNMRQLCVNIVNANPAAPPSMYSKDVRELLFQMLRKNPRHRPSINSILANDVIKRRIQGLLDERVMESEFNHTVLHGFNIMDRNFKPAGANNNDNNNNKNNNNNNPVSNANINPIPRPAFAVDVKASPALSPNIQNPNNANNLNIKRTPSPTPSPSIAVSKPEQNVRVEIVSDMIADKKKRLLEEQKRQQLEEQKKQQLEEQKRRVLEDQKRAAEAARILEERKRNADEAIQKIRQQRQQQLQEQQIKLLAEQRERRLKLEKERLEREKLAVEKAEALERERLRIIAERQKLQQRDQKVVVAARGPVPVPVPASNANNFIKIEKAFPSSSAPKIIPAAAFISDAMPPRPPPLIQEIVKGASKHPIPVKFVAQKHEQLLVQNQPSSVVAAKVGAVISSVEKRKEVDNGGENKSSYISNLKQFDREKMARELLEEERQLKLAFDKECCDYEIDLSDNVTESSELMNNKKNVGHVKIEDSRGSNPSLRPPKNEWIHNLKLKMGGHPSSQSKQIDIMPPAIDDAAGLKQVNDKVSPDSCSDDFEVIDKKNKNNVNISNNVVINKMKKVEVPNGDIIAGVQPGKNRHVDVSNSPAIEVVSPRQINLKGLENKMDVLKRQMDIMRSFKPAIQAERVQVAFDKQSAAPRGSNSKAANIASNRNNNSNNSNCPTPLLVASEKSSRVSKNGNAKAIGAKPSGADVASGLKAANSGKNGGGSKKAGNNAKPPLHNKDKLKSENRKPIDANELRAIRDLERENLRQLMREKRKEVNSNVGAEIDIKYNNYMLGGGGGVDDVSSDDGVPSNNKLEGNNNSIDDPSIVEIALDEGLDRSPSSPSSTSSNLFNDDDDDDYDGHRKCSDVVNSDQNGYEDLVNSDDSSSIGSHSGDSLSNKLNYITENPHNDVTIPHEDRCLDEVSSVSQLKMESVDDDDDFEHIGSERQFIAPASRGHIGEYSILLQHMQDILKLPSVNLNKTKYDMKTMIFISDTIPPANSVAAKVDRDTNIIESVEEVSIHDYSSDDDEFYSNDGDKLGEEEEDKGLGVDDEEVGFSGNGADLILSDNFDFYVSGCEDTGGVSPSVLARLETHLSLSKIESVYAAVTPLINSDGSETVDPFKGLSLKYEVGPSLANSIKDISIDSSNRNCLPSDYNDDSVEILPDEDNSSNNNGNEQFDFNLNDISTHSLQLYLQNVLGKEALAQAIELLRAVDTLIPSEETSMEAEDVFLVQIEGIIGQQGMQYLDLLYKLVMSL